MRAVVECYMIYVDIFFWGGWLVQQPPTNKNNCCKNQLSPSSYVLRSHRLRGAVEEMLCQRPWFFGSASRGVGKCSRQLLVKLLSSGFEKDPSENIQWINYWLTSGKRLHNYRKIHHAINGKIHYLTTGPWLQYFFVCLPLPGRVMTLKPCLRPKLTSFDRVARPMVGSSPPLEPKEMSRGKL